MTTRQIGTRGSDTAWPEGFQTSSACCSQPQVRGKKRNQTGGGIRQLQEKIDQIQTEQAESARHLTLELHTREFGTALVALEGLVERRYDGRVNSNVSGAEGQYE
ncbi:MAG: hypothetical protein RBR41_01130 [Desulfovibrio sp.]|uniref:hypothetical protein n=1 Tax=Desulfovibrio sp. TaxID=885 RepID=UPI002A36F67A|nr:hypothetical protein [Desulfovibrio sp.]MDY0258255.1 hypothetical protein [Desulfovibrio sp.]